MRILISGGKGLLAKELIKSNYRHEIISYSHEYMNISQYSNIFDIVNKANKCNKNFDIFLHCAAMTHPMKNHYTYPIKSICNNIIGTANVAMICKEFNIKPVYISTDYVYPGDLIKDDSYTEDDIIKPVDNYGWSKLGGECSINMIENHLILRCCFSQRPFRHKSAFINLYKSYIYVDEIAPIIWKLIDKDCYGTYNVGGKKQSVYEFAKISVPNVKPISTNTVKEKLPYNTSMDISKLQLELNND